MTAEPLDLTLPWPGGVESVTQCPVCATTERRQEQAELRDWAFAAAPGTWSLQRCLGCQALYLDPRPDPASLHLAYRNYYTHAASSRSGDRSRLGELRMALSNGYRNRIFATNKQPSLAAGSFLMPLFPAKAAHIRREDRGLTRAGTKGRRLLDVGCGNGMFMVWARELGWDGYGVEMDAAAAAVARGNGIPILGAQLHELGDDHNGSFDAVTLSHVIEHVYDPVATLRECRRLLKPGGYLWIETPNTSSVGYELYGPHWRGLEPPRHLVLFNGSSLRWILDHVGFERIKILPSGDVADVLFTASAAMKLGRIGGLDTRPLPEELGKAVSAAAKDASAMVRRDPGRSEFVTVAAYRPSGSR